MLHYWLCCTGCAEDAGFDWKILGPDVGNVDYTAWQCDQVSAMLMMLLLLLLLRLLLMVLLMMLLLLMVVVLLAMCMPRLPTLLLVSLFACFSVPLPVRASWLHGTSPHGMTWRTSWHGIGMT